MNFSKMRLVASREYSIRVKKKSFIFTTILVPILFAALMIVPSLIMLMGGDDELRKVMVVDHSGIVAQTLVSSETIEYQVVEGVSIDSLKTNFSSLGVYALVDISPLYANDNA